MFMRARRVSLNWNQPAGRGRLRVGGLP
jgi:hypothetical protein